MAETPVRAGPTLITAANTSQTIVTAGAAATWLILRDITVTNESAAMIAFTLGLGTSNTDAAGKRLVKDRTLQPGDDPWSWSGFVPLIGSGSTPDLLYAVCSLASGMTVTVGYVSGP